MFFKFSIFLILISPLSCLGQSIIIGRVINHGDKKGVSNANVFLNNATIGDHTSDSGAFVLHNALPGKYQMVVSIIGFATYNQVIIVKSGNNILPDIEISPKITNLKEVVVKFKTDPNRGLYYEWFKDNFLGTSDLAKECKILNRDVLDFNYDETTHTLTASSYTFLEIENHALGYRIKYLLTDFSYENNGELNRKVYYKGPVLFEELKGTTSDKNHWKKNRRDAYENSPMHFLRSALGNTLYQEGFKVQSLLIYDNQDRPSDSLINSKIAFYRSLKTFNYSQADSLTYWVKKFKLPKKFEKLITLNKQDIIKTTDQPGQYALSCPNTDKLFIAYNKDHRYHIKNWSDYLYNANNNENTVVQFDSPDAFFNNNGVITNPYSVMYFGVWGRNRVSELLPINYEVQ